MSARTQIANALVAKFKSLLTGTSPYTTNLHMVNATTKLKFWDEIQDFPYICVVMGSEVREYHPSNFTWGMLNLALKLYVYGEDSNERLEALITDVETVISKSEKLELASGRSTEEILITSIITDEGLLTPYGVGEVNILVRYQV